MLNNGITLHQRYQIEQLLGQGGMGAVYSAVDHQNGARVAIKENYVASQAAYKQFEREASMLAHLSHPNLPRVTDYFISSQLQYLVMDFVEGSDLASILSQYRVLPEKQVLPWIGQICNALSYLHRQSPPVIHRDIKPANIKIGSNGHVMLVDFGIAKFYDAKFSTTAGAKAVTPGYSPPEQYGNGRTDNRSDIYALGATLYHLLTGQRPPDSLQRIVSTNARIIPPNQLNASISPHIAQAMLKALSISADQRYQHIENFQKALTAPNSYPLQAKKNVQMARANQDHHINYARKNNSQESMILIGGGIIALLILMIAGALLMGQSGSSDTNVSRTMGTSSGNTSVSAPTPTQSRFAGYKQSFSQNQIIGLNWNYPLAQGQHYRLIVRGVSGVVIDQILDSNFYEISSGYLPVGEYSWTVSAVSALNGSELSQSSPTYFEVR